MKQFKERFVKIAVIFIAMVIMATSSSTGNAQLYMNMPIDRIIDGDTIKTHLSPRRLPPPLNTLSIRIAGIDTPELPAKSFKLTGKLGRAKCVKEALLALRARDALIDMANGHKRMRVSKFKWGTYGSRIVANVSIGGKDVGIHLTNMGLAVPYGPGIPKHDWCKSTNN